MDLVYKHEKPLLRIAIIFSAIFWIALTIGTFGILLIYLLLGYLFFLFAHSAFISHLKGSGVKITEEQYPDLHEKLIRNCEKVGLKEVPEAYLLRTDFFNALATRFLGRHFVVLFTDVVDALESQPGAIDFYIGHELGHIHRNHLNWRTFIMPASLLPVLGTALRRAEEYTCDRYGVACCESESDIKSAIAAIAAGDSRWATLNVDSYMDQIAITNGFWMSFNELTSDYPWLTKRMATALAASKGEDITHPRRHGLAWFLACFIPRFGQGGAASLLVTVALIGILAAIAIPAYQDYVQRARLATAHSTGSDIADNLTNYVIENNQWPASLTDLGYSQPDLIDSANQFDVGLYENGVLGINVGVNKDGAEQYLVLEPQVIEGDLVWNCFGENIPLNWLPHACR